MIQLTNLSKSFGGQTVFRDVSLKVAKNQKIGFVGRNGSGKSTLFRMILGEESYDSGEISIPRNYRIGALKQHFAFTENSVREECALVLPEDEQWNFYKIEKLLFGLGFSEADLDKNPLSFSGGYQIRINLVKLLATEPNMLLLDEPTNYLDLPSLRWLKGFIHEFEGEVILITHDREFMDAVSTHTMGVHRKGLRLIEGDTHKYYATLEMEDETYEKTRANQEKKRKELEEFVARNKARASTAAMAQSKQKELDKMEEMGDLESEADLSFDFNYAESPAKIMMRVENIGFGYKPNELLFQNLTFALEKGKRIAIIGKNGKGKSTLLNYIAGELSRLQGELHYHPSTKFAHFGQTNIERLNTTATIVEEIASASKELGIPEARAIAGRMMFPGELGDKKIEVLSGGERSRVMLGKIIATPANLLFLDEPTNHLDMHSIDALADAIEGFKGSLIMVTHSEMLLRRLADTLIIFHKGGAEYFDGTYDEFLEKIGWEEEEVNKPKKKKPKIDYKERKRLRSMLTRERNDKRKPYTREIKLCEEYIEKLEQEMVLKNEALDKASVSGDTSAIMELSKEVGTYQVQIDEWFERLEAATEKDDGIVAEYEEKLAEIDL
ncbi:ABC-F family ATP-binding cassette domain-containing protein [Sulfurovum sp. ST-21]|uniref:ABC-F family ATP-binding cassette domain-containing protein n=1 Tax=Sulfurovum indicum TaxID=2779528 RepID=A0A7M1S3X6_9BACT|nr:ABC-F family ATP-binding cassette domain-containing protein [Sulfurovum indicum]QOR61419.1 ABC-F family ATP-binding cassette domain-containing protein [Sulfurovum indicum]